MKKLKKIIDSDINASKIERLNTMASSNSSFNTLNNCLNYKRISTKESNFPEKNKKHFQDTTNSENLNCKKVKNEVDQNLTTSKQSLPSENDSRYVFGNEFGHIITDSDESIEIDEFSLNRSPFSLGPSNFSEQPNSTNSPTKSTQNSIQVMYDEPKPNRLFNVQNKMCFNNFSSPKGTSEETIKAMHLAECTSDNDLSVKINSKKLNSEPDSETKMFDRFVEDLEIFDSDVLYNVTLLKHLRMMKLLVQKISKTPFDEKLPLECIFLSSLPVKKPGPKTLTQKKIENEYSDIDSDEWNKLMVKRLSIFTARIGLLPTNEESFYTLVNLAIDFIKNLAITMDKKFDIEKNQSCLDSINPINKNLEQVS